MPATRRLFAILGLLAVAAVATDAAAAPPIPCKTAKATRLPAYATQGSWSPDGSRLLLVDPVYEEVHTYSAKNGRYLGPIPAPAAIGKRSFFPVSARSSGNQLVVESYPQRLLFLGDRFQLTSLHEPLREMRSQAASAGGGPTTEVAGAPADTLKSMFMWDLAAGDIVACGDVQRANGSWITGIVRFPVDDPADFRVQTATDFPDEGWVFCRLGFPYITSIGDRAFVLLLNDRPGIYESTAKGTWQRLEYELDVPGPVRLPEFSSQGGFVTTMAEVERTTMPVGLYSWDDALFVLYRRFDARTGETRWTLDEVDPATGRQRGDSAVIHANAAHLMLIPGKMWALVEKGPALEFGDQETRAIRILNASALPRPLQGEICGTR
jgi:hypothetical protein